MEAPQLRGVLAVFDPCELDDALYLLPVDLSRNLEGGI